MHHVDLPNSPVADPADLCDARPWWKLLNRYHWFVFVVAALGWLFDTMDQQLFTLARAPAMTELLARHLPFPDNADGQAGSTAEAGGWRNNPVIETAGFKAKAQQWGDLATSVFLIGWATGGLVFGVLGDRIGRVRTMLLTILVYSLFTGMSSFSYGVVDFCLWRFMTGLGVGGEFAVGVSLVAEVMPTAARPYALAFLQSLSAVGNVTAAFIGIGGVNWKVMFLVGAAPALLSLLVRGRLKEPERWQAASADQGVQKQLGSYRALFGEPRLRHRAIVGLLLASAGVIGLWGIGFYSPELTRDVFGKGFVAQGLEGKALEAVKARWAGFSSLMFNLGAFFGIYLFGPVSERIGRRPTFAICLVCACLSTMGVFWFLGKAAGVYDIFWMTPVMGFFQLSLFGGYAVYFPELFPTRLRSTGVSFCYNVARFVAAAGPLVKSMLSGAAATATATAGQPAAIESIRLTGVMMCAIFLVGLAVLPFCPETRNQPLPE